MTIAFAPILIIVGLPLFLIGKIENLNFQRKIKIVFYVLLLTLLILYLMMNFLS
jgi:hypothetical protein